MNPTIKVLAWTIVALCATVAAWFCHAFSRRKKDTDERLAHRPERIRLTVDLLSARTVHTRRWRDNVSFSHSSKSYNIHHFRIDRSEKIELYAGNRLLMRLCYVDGVFSDTVPLTPGESDAVRALKNRLWTLESAYGIETTPSA